MNFQEKGKAFLEHYGIKGMRWGVRRTDAQLARAGGETSGSKSDDSSSNASTAKAPNSKTKTKGVDPNDLTDKELQQVVNRINMEQQYSRLTTSPTAMQRGAKFMTEIGVSVAKTQITKVANDKASNLIGNHMFNKAGIPVPPNRFSSLYGPPSARDRVG